MVRNKHSRYKEYPLLFKQTVISMFSKGSSYLHVLFSAFRQGMHDLKVWPNVEADPSVMSTTPGKTKDSNDQMSRLAKVCTQYATISNSTVWIQGFIAESVIVE